VISSAILHGLRWLGWLVLGGSAIVVLATLLTEGALGPVPGQACWPTPSALACLANTVWMSAAATLMSLVIALPVAAGLSLADRPWKRSVLAALAVMPLLTMPSTFAYAWTLLATVPQHAAHPLAPIARVLTAVGWNRTGVQIVQAAWALASWLWPIPALVLAAAFRRMGLPVYQLASLDARPTAALLHAALPAMRPPLIAALAIVFVLAAADSAVPPLMGVTEVWSVEMRAQAAIAARFDRPAAYLLWQSWPLLALIAVVATCAVPGLRQMNRWAEDASPEELGTSRPGHRLSWIAGVIVAASVGVFPIAVFCIELANGRSTPGQAIRTAYETLRGAGLASLIAAGGAAFAGLCVSLALLSQDGDHAPRLLRRVAASSPGRLGLASVLICALLPPGLVGGSLAAFYVRISDPAHWNIYDCTPLVWIAALVARFAFLPVCVVQLLDRRIPRELMDAARCDGASPIQAFVAVRLPLLWGGLSAAAIMTACLSLSEVAVSVLVQPPRFFGGSLAVEIDAQMHYGRQNETVASALLLMLPPMIAAAMIPLWLRRR